jgi:hypothetical protein
MTLFLGNLNSLTFDFVVRNKLVRPNINFFIMKQFPILPPSAYTPEDLAFIVPRVLELTYTAVDLTGFAQDLWQSAGEEMRTLFIKQWKENHSFSVPSTPPFAPCENLPIKPFTFDPNRRAVRRAELDARYARPYGLTRDELRYILDPADVMGPTIPQRPSGCSRIRKPPNSASIGREGWCWRRGIGKTKRRLSDNNKATI